LFVILLTMDLFQALQAVLFLLSSAAVAAALLQLQRLAAAAALLQ
jgi:hypothetical protein